MRSMFTIRLLPALLLLWPHQNLSAQTTTSGALTGVVTDQAHAVVPGTWIEIKDIARGTTQSTKTDSEGIYQFFFLAPGTYTLNVRREGFRKESRLVTIVVGPPGTVNVTLEIATQAETVKVTDEAPLISAENGDVAGTIDQKQISELPNAGNDLTNIAQLAPGVLMDTDNNFGAPLSILGMPATSNIYTMDGASQTDNAYGVPLSGALYLMLGQNQIQEAGVVTSGYSGEYGGAAGGNINYVTKSGNDQIHGNVQYFWNGRILNANGFFLKATGNARPFDIANQWAASVGGPITKNKLFYFFDNEGLRVLVPQLMVIQAPSAPFEAATLANIERRFGAGSASDKFYQKVFHLFDAAPATTPRLPGVLGDSSDPLGCDGFQEQGFGLGISVPCTVNFFNVRGRPSQDMLTSGRVDWNISERDQTFARMEYQNGHSAIYLDGISPLFDADNIATSWQGQIIETHSFGSAGASQFLFAGSSHLNSIQMPHGREALATLPTSVNFGPTFLYSGLGGWGIPQGSTYDVGPRFEISEDVARIWRSHKFGLGARFETIHWNVSQPWGVIGTLMPLTLDAFYQGGVDPLYLAGKDPTPDYTQLSQSFPAAQRQEINFHNLAFYGQDEWHARPNLSFTFALRTEHRSNPICESRCFARFTGSFDAISHDPAQPYNQAILVNQEHAFAATDAILWSPRFSFAWQPRGVSHGVALRGGIGIFYDPVPSGFAFNFIANPPLLNAFTVAGNNLSPGEASSLFADAAASNSALVHGFRAGENLAEIQADISAINPADSFAPPAVTSPQGVTRTPQYQRWSLDLQQSLSAGTSLSVGYFGHHGIHELVQNPSANAFGFGSFPKALCSSPAVPPCADPRFSQVTTLSSAAVSNYNGVITSFQHRFRRWNSGLFQINYTFGHAFDEVSNGGIFPFNGLSSVFPQDPKNLRGSYGPAEYDVRHSLNSNYVWQLPLSAVLRHRGPDRLTSGWQISGTVFYHSGFPYTVFDSFKASALQQNNYFGPIYAVPVGPFGPDPYCGEGAAFTNAVQPCQPPQLLPDGTTVNPGARFVQAGCETGVNTGNLGRYPLCDGKSVTFAQGRNRFRGPSYFNTDFAIMKNTKLPRWEGALVEIGFQFFNLFNHPNFGTPENDIQGAAGFGEIFGQNAPYTNLMGNNTGGDSARRLIQVKAELRF